MPKKKVLPKPADSLLSSSEDEWEDVAETHVPEANDQDMHVPVSHKFLKEASRALFWIVDLQCHLNLPLFLKLLMLQLITKLS